MSAASKSENPKSHLNGHVTYSYNNNGLNSHKQKYTQDFIFHSNDSTKCKNSD